MLAELVPVADQLLLCPLPDSGGQEGGPGADPAQVASIARSRGANASTADSFISAVANARASGATRTYICGSIYLCGAVLDANGERVE